MSGFKSGTYTVLVATDIAARGIDVSGISHVINFDMPATAETYTHRTGRTGRASCTGAAFTFATSEDHKMIKAIERSLGAPLIYKKYSDFSSAPEIPECKAEKQVTAARTGKKHGQGRGKRKPQRSRAVACDFGFRAGA